MTHLDDTEILAALYAPTGETDAHLSACSTCAARLASFAAAVREDETRLHEGIDTKPETFWAVQRASILSRIRSTPARRETSRAARWAIAAALAIAVTGGLVSMRDQPPTEVRVSAPVAEPQIELPSADPWEVEELASWEEAVQWETWLEPGDAGNDGGA